MMRRGPLIAFGVFVAAGAALAWGILASISDADLPTISTEVGPWALRLRVAELFLLWIAAGSVLLLIEQLSLTARWNRRLSYHQFFPEVPTLDKLEKFVELTKAEKIDAYDKGEPIPAAVANALVADGDKKRIVTAYLNDFEEFAAAVRRGLVDEDYAYDVESLRVVRAWTVFKPFITSLRALVVYAGGYTELETLAMQWIARDEKEAKKARPSQT